MIRRKGRLVGTQRGNLDDTPNPGLGAGGKERDGGVTVQRLEGLLPGLPDDADAVDHGVDVAQGWQPAGRGGHVPEVDPGLPRRRNDTMTGLRQDGCDIATDEAAGAGEQDVHGALWKVSAISITRPSRLPTSHKPISSPPRVAIRP
ncbi:hypothetical protein SDC9_197413 [bioreactor metagenome]|uniref:Uncharacterized protein n=1 Tax=bioreactor metagenome TaxID=1076179 RepID=A0A645IEN2_9ZZZZ